MEIDSLIKNGFFIKLSVENVDDLFEKLNCLLLNNNYVNGDFLKAVKEREKNFPTGIENREHNIALPHVDSKYVNENALIICSLTKPIQFKKMDDNSKSIEVSLVFMLLISDLKLHIKAISDLTKVWSNKRIMAQIGLSNSKEDVLELLKKEKI